MILIIFMNFCHPYNTKLLINWSQSFKNTISINSHYITAVHLVFNPLSQFIPQLELYSELQLSLCSDLIDFSVPKSTWWVLVNIQGDGNLAETQMKKGWKFEQFLNSRTKLKETLKTFNVFSNRRWWRNRGKIHLCTAYCHK